MPHHSTVLYWVHSAPSLRKKRRFCTRTVLHCSVLPLPYAQEREGLTYLADVYVRTSSKKTFIIIIAWASPHK